MIFIELTTDAFEDVRAKQLAAKGYQSRLRTGAGAQFARRPARGLEIKEDTYANIKLIRSDGVELPLLDSSSPNGETTAGYANFMLQSVQEARMEKHQIVETFGESYIFFFGEAPRFLDIQAVIVNSLDFNWEAEWWENYNRYLRGTRSVELGARTYIFYDDNIVEGFIVMSQASKVSEQPFVVNMNFRMFVTNYTNITFIGDPQFPIRASVDLPPGIELTDPNSGQRLIDRLRGEARQKVLTDGADRVAGILAAQANSIGAYRAAQELSELTGPSIGISADAWKEIENLGAAGKALKNKLTDLANRWGHPIRGFIYENLDEYVGYTGMSTNSFALDSERQSAVASGIRSQQEVNDLFISSIQFLSCYAADINNPKKMLKVGLMPKFGSDAKQGATFNPIPGVPFGIGATTEGFPSKAEFEKFKQDPLGAVFGNPVLEEGSYAGTASNKTGYTLGAADPLYGYPSDFMDGPGYGVNGFGDFGGLGFGSSNSAGDPGYRDPNTMTFAGTEDTRDAFERFLMIREEDPYTISAGGGLGLSTSGLTGGASVSIPGHPKPFTLSVVDGDLDPDGRARQRIEAYQALLAKQKFGFSVDNPFGVKCPPSGGLSFEVSVP